MPVAVDRISLADREAGPQPDRLAYGGPGDRVSLAAYELDWYVWRAIRRDAGPTRDEADAAFRVLADRLGYPGVGLWDEE